MAIPQRAIDDERLAAKALERLAAQEALIEQQEQAEAAQREQQARRQMAEQQARQDAGIVGELQALGSLYEKRRTAAAAGNVPAFWQAEQEIRGILAGMEWGDPAGMNGNAQGRRRETLRTAAGLPARHWQIGLTTPPATDGERVLRVLMAAIVRGMIGPRGFTVGEKNVVIDVEQV